MAVRFRIRGEGLQKVACATKVLLLRSTVQMSLDVVGSSIDQSVPLVYSSSLLPLITLRALPISG